MDKVWNEMYEKAKAVLNPREVSSIIEAGGVAAAVEYVLIVLVLSAFVLNEMLFLI